MCILKWCTVQDDHDFGQNNGDRHFENKDAVKEIFLRFVDELCSSPRWDRDGLYTSYLIPISSSPSSSSSTPSSSPSSASSAQSSSPSSSSSSATPPSTPSSAPPTPSFSSYRVKLILLDNRYNLDHPTGDLLGEPQWAWLAAQVRDPAADLLLIASGIQFLPRDKPIQEKWFEMRASFDRLLDLVHSAHAPAVFLSGDVHLADLLRSDCAGVGYPLFELTSSGLTHCLKGQAGVFHELALHLLHSRGMRTLSREYSFGVIVCVCVCARA
jgi:alkaline phosphatase D